MKRIVFFWVEKFQEIDFMNHENQFLFENFGVDLSSKYHFEYKWNPVERVLYDLNEHLNTDLIKYSKKIHDLKVLVGNNGTGKTTLLKLIGNIVSGNNPDMIPTYVIVWEEEGKFFYYAKGCGCLCAYGRSEKLPFLKTVIYSSDFSRYHDESVEANNFINIRKNYLMRRLDNDSINQYCLEEENVLIDFLIDFSRIKCSDGESFLWKMINVPPRLIFTFADDAVEKKVNHLVANGTIKGCFLDREGMRIIEKSRYSFFSKMLFVAWLDLWEQGEAQKKTSSEEIIEDFDLYMREKYPDVFEKVNSFVQSFPVGYVSFFENGPKIPIAMFNLENDYDRVCEFRDGLRRINPHFLFMSATIDYPLSAGEYEYMQFFSRFLSVLKKEKEMSNFLLILDEVDRGLHPEWQRLWFTKFLECLDAISVHYDIELNIQLLMATHSPFMLSDFADENVLKLVRKPDESGFKPNVKCDDSSTKCFGGNIYDIMKDGFFLESSIGGFVEKQINKIIIEVKKCKKENRNLSKEYVLLINKIGNPILKSLLLQKIRCVVREG